MEMNNDNIEEDDSFLLKPKQVDTVLPELFKAIEDLEYISFLFL
jgi:hypothetical protein